MLRQHASSKLSHANDRWEKSMPSKNQLRNAPSSAPYTHAAAMTGSLRTGVTTRDTGFDARARDPMPQPLPRRRLCWHSIGSAMAWVMREIIDACAESGETLYPSFFLLGEHACHCSLSERPRCVGCIYNQRRDHATTRAWEVANSAPAPGTREPQLESARHRSTATGLTETTGFARPTTAPAISQNWRTSIASPFAKLWSALRHEQS
jgi:hypothetical protein